MANHKNIPGGWHTINLGGGYVSCIKIRGLPILPPMMTEERREEMRQLRAKAMEVEHRLVGKRNCNMSEDTAGGEALYEGAVDDLNVPNSIAVCLTEPTESPSLQIPNSETGQHKASLEAELSCDAAMSTDEDDMLKQFDPYAPVSRKSHKSPSAGDHSFSRDQGTVQNLVTSEESGTSKPSSADSSFGLSNSTDLNNYMDVTGTSGNVSQMHSEIRAGSESTTSNTLRPDSDFTECSERRSSVSISEQGGKTTYEDLNKYLDVILNNSSDSSQCNAVVDNRVPCVDANGNKNLEFGRPCDESTTAPQPLVGPCDGLQSKALTDNKSVISSSNETSSSLLFLKDKNQSLEIDTSSDTRNFLQQCALSPVLHTENRSNACDEKVQLYLQNLMTGHVQICTFPQTQPSSQREQAVEYHSKMDSPGKTSPSESKSNKTECSKSEFGDPPRLVRSNSYTLDSPSPLLVAHMEAELRKNSPCKLPPEKSKGLSKERARTAVSIPPARKVWDIEKAKNVPSWYNKHVEKSSAANQSKKENHSSSYSMRITPKKVIHQSLPSSITGSTEKMENTDVKTPKTRSLVSKSGTNSAKLNPVKKAQISSSSQGSSVPTSVAVSPTHTTVSPGDADPNQKLSLLLSELQLQHTREMEELLNRQRKEQEAIRLALLQQQNLAVQLAKHDINISQNNAFLSKTNISPEKPSISNSSGPNNSLRRSPLLQDRLLQMERRNTSPSIYDKISSDELQKCLMEYNKSLSISLDDVCENAPNVQLLNLDNEGAGEVSQHLSAVNCAESKFIMTSDNHHISSIAISKGNMADKNYPNLSSVNLQLGSGNSAEASSKTRNETSAPFHPESFGSNLQTNLTCSGLVDKNDLKYSLPMANLKQSESYAASIPGAMSASMPPAQFLGTNHIPANMSASLPSSFTHEMVLPLVGGSAHGKRRAWCSRQLFSADDNVEGNQGRLSNTWEKQKHLAAAKIQAGVRGYLTRRLLQSERVQNCITTIRDTIVCALQLQRDCTPHVEASDLELHGRLIQQLGAACEELHSIFFSLTVVKQMAIIAADREWLRSRTPRSSSSKSTRPLSRATQIAMQRKIMQSDHSETSSMKSVSSSVSRTKRRSWAVVENQSRPSSTSTNALNSNCEMVEGCLSQSSAPAGHILQRSASAGSRRKPWR